jgi:hypothetical protein
MSLGVIGFEAQGRAELGDRLVQLTLVTEDGAEGRVGLRKVGPEP